MSQTESPVHGGSELGKFKAPDENFLRLRQVRMRLLVLQVLSVMATILVMIWLIQKPITLVSPQDSREGDLALSLVPILAAALSINLFLEMGISFLEQNDRVLVAYLGRGFRLLEQAEREVFRARRWHLDVYEHYSYQMEELQKITGQVAKTKDPQKFVELTTARIKAARDLLDLAEARVNNAENRLDSVVDFSAYRRVKLSVTNYFSVLLGVLVATATSMQIFGIMGVQLNNPKLDMFLTGLFIGGLVYPVHQVIANIWDILTKLVKK